MKKNNFLRILMFGVILGFASCSNDDTPTVAELPDSMMEPETTTFNVTISNVVNYLDALIFNTPVGADMPAPILEAGGSYSINFKAEAHTKLSFATMSVVSNDWFFAPDGAGINLFSDGAPVTGNITDQVYLWDVGVELEDPATRTSEEGGATAGEPDTDNTVRKVETDVSEFIKVMLSFNDMTEMFTLSIENIRGIAVETNHIAITPGIVVLHTQENALFEEGQTDRGYGLAKIAVTGNPTDLHDWFTEIGTDGAPLRLSSSFTVLAPGIVYAFDDDSDPVYTVGEAATEESGLESIAEDGNSITMYDYITGTLELPAAKSNETMPVGPGQSLTFTIEVPEGYKLGYNAMFVFSNDWFIAGDNTGSALFNADGTAITSTTLTSETYLYDAGTEVDQPTGLGMDQAPFQSGPNTGVDDENNLIRKVIQIDDVVFGKGVIQSNAAIAGHLDARGGYNLVEITVEAK